MRHWRRWMPAASAPGSGPQPSLKPLRPCTRTTGGPLPCSIVDIRTTPGTIRGRVGYPGAVTTDLELVAPRGYCAGVERAIETVERVLLELGPPVYVRGEIVHARSGRRASYADLVDAGYGAAGE